MQEEKEMEREKKMIGKLFSSLILKSRMENKSHGWENWIHGHWSKEENEYSFQE